MIKEMKLGFTLVKYGFKPKVNLIFAIGFMVIGIISEVATGGTQMLGPFYLLLTGMFIYQMIVSLDLSELVQMSGMKKVMQTKLPVYTSSFFYLIVFTVILIERVIMIKTNPALESELCKTLFEVEIILFFAMIYVSLVYKYFILGMLFLFASVFGGQFGITYIIYYLNLDLTLLKTGIAGYVIIAVGTAIELLVTNLLYKKEYSKLAFRGMMKNI